MLFGLSASAQAHAATLTKVEQSAWGVEGLPSYVNMYIYVPDQLAAKPPIVVGAHYCTGNAMAYFTGVSGIVAAANKNGFIMIFPEATDRNCWDVGSVASLTHDGKGDTQAIAEMVRYTIATYGADASRVYVVGTSSGAMMTQALLGVYPDVFRAGAEFSGVPCGCWSVGYNDASGQWSSSCATGLVKKSAVEWGDRVRGMYPEYSGHRPRLQLWHGNMDEAINYVNFGESIKEFTNLLGLSETPSSTDTPEASYERQVWTDSCGATVLEATTIVGGTHQINFEASAVLKFFGLDQAGAPDPEGTCSPSEGGGAGADSGSGGSGKSSSGCGCRVGGGEAKLGDSLWAGLAGLALAFVRRRKRRD
ncbi:MAG: PHB depolymerase family esterase [Polyangiaceae bacterium]